MKTFLQILLVLIVLDALVLVIAGSVLLMYRFDVQTALLVVAGILMATGGTRLCLDTLVEL